MPILHGQTEIMCIVRVSLDFHLEIWIEKKRLKYGRDLWWDIYIYGGIEIEKTRQRVEKIALDTFQFDGIDLKWGAF